MSNYCQQSCITRTTKSDDDCQNKYLLKHNVGLQVLFFEMIGVLGIGNSTLPWYSPVTPNPLYESPEAQAFWDIPGYAEHSHALQNRVDARVINHEEKVVHAVEMSCPWIESTAKKDGKKTTKYGPLRWELKQKFPGYKIKQHNSTIDVLGGSSRDVERSYLLGFEHCSHIQDKLVPC